MCAAFAVLTSFWMCAAAIHFARVAGLGVDRTQGVQKFHRHWVPRLGGLPIFIAFATGLLATAWLTNTKVAPTAFFIVASLPAFMIGLLEDLTGRIGTLTRLVFTMVSAALGWWLLGASLGRVDLPWVDAVLAAFPALAFVLTLVAVAGVANSLNIIDGYNGLSGFFAVIVLVAITLLAAIVRDELLLRIGLILGASVFGFLVWNFPFGRIFLGDSGAYLVGFLIAELSILLVVRHPEVSAWFPLLLLAYPVWETLFSMYRRALLRGAHVGNPDALHLHHLIYRRLMRRYVGSRDSLHRMLRNSFTSIYLWVLAVLCAIPAMLFWSDTKVLMGFCALFAVGYVALYRSLVRFRAPSFLVARPRRQWTAPAAATEAVRPAPPT